MKRVLYYCMLLAFFVCFIWNALSKKDSIMGTAAAPVQAEQTSLPNDMALASNLP